MQSGAAGRSDTLATLTEEQIQQLENNFAQMKQPNGSSLILIAAECGLSEELTAQWFKQRMAKWRQSEGFPAESGSVKD
ncbi:homeodomain-only protein [Hemitrygon akajei]|uniref:homeodomain-only protein n=1 Tax=Hemitrygon akajei TaxID=2704970 RepID=UPI003BFA20A4